MLITLMIPGDPVGKARPFVTKRGITFTPKKTVSMENLIKFTFSEKYPGFIPILFPVSMKIIIYQKIPKSFSKRQREQALSNFLRPAKRPEIDNCTKLIFDSLIGRAYHDDNQIIELEALKFYSDRPRVEIEIKEITKEE